MALEMDKVLGNILKERFPDYSMRLLSYTDTGTGWEVRAMVKNSNMATVLEDGFNILISDREVLIHLIQNYTWI